MSINIQAGFRKANLDREFFVKSRMDDYELEDGWTQPPSKANFQHLLLNPQMKTLQKCKKRMEMKKEGREEQDQVLASV
ncbi:hypothetical protein RND71_028675 [Anisodus tanguticus]|uniref:Uncharacterized protein n=1 Tax=Anisodus tanguticus TaxID=243964 RepID=A0AAE1RLG8_9SOLA|nr:hypothetical protein RND71_028675 [Anisodus tanguticus]